MSEPKWAAAVRTRTEDLIERLAQTLPENAGPVELEAALTSLEAGYFGDVAQAVLNTQTREKKD
jgi:hypothetical protein